MKILFIVNSLSGQGGTERVTCNLANLFSEELGHKIIIANRGTEKEKSTFFLNEKVLVQVLPYNYFLFYIHLNKLIQQVKPDIILVQNMGKLSLLASLLKIPKPIKLYSLEHVSFLSHPCWLRTLSPYFYKRYNKIITLTDSDAICYRKFHKDVTKITNISAYDVTKLNYEYDINSKIIIAIGRLTYQKNFLALLTAWKIVEKHHPDWKLDIYGEGEDRIQLESYIIEHKLNNVTLKGNVVDLSVAYQTASFLVMSSRYEGLGLVLIEAQSFGLPLISFDCPYGPGEVIKNHYNGYLIENQNTGQLSEKILFLVENNDLRATFSKNSKKNAINYTDDVILERWISVLG